MTEGDIASASQRRALEKLKRSEGLTKEPISVDVKIENETLAQTLKLREELREKEEKLGNIEAMFNQVKEKLVQRLNEEGIEIDEDQIENVDDLTAYSGVLNELRERSGKPSGTPSGTIPLSGQNADRENRGFDSYREMIEFLIGLEGTKGGAKREAKKVLDEFWKRSQKAIGEAKRPIHVVIPSNEQLAEGKTLKSIINERYRKKHRLNREEEA